MPIREIAGKVIAFGVVALSLIAGGILALIGPHAPDDTLNLVLGIAMILLGLLAGGVGTLVIAGILLEDRRAKREAELHVAPRPGALGPPPAWGMGDIGRVDRANIVQVGHDAPGGGGVARVMNVSVTNFDAPIVIAIAVVWTIVFTLWLAPTLAQR